MYGGFDGPNRLVCHYWRYCFRHRRSLVPTLAIGTLHAKGGAKPGDDCLWGWRTKVIVGGSHIILPRFQQAKYFSLELMPFKVELTQEIYLADQKTYVNVEATVLIKVLTDAGEPDILLLIEQLQSKNQLTRAELFRALSANDMRESILRAVELFLDKSESERTELIRIVIEGHLRGLIGQRTFDDLVKDPEVLIEGMFKTTRGDMDRMGLEMVSFTVQGIRRGYPEG